MAVSAEAAQVHWEARRTGPIAPVGTRRTGGAGAEGAGLKGDRSSGETSARPEFDRGNIVGKFVRCTS